MARANGRPEAYELLDAGVDHVYRDTFDTSLRMGIDALRLLGLRAFHAHRSAKMFRKHDEESVRDLAQMRHDKKAYFTAARQRIKDLEQILLSELDDRDRKDDIGWDTDSLCKEYGDEPADGE
jgi:hypothetical protein